MKINLEIPDWADQGQHIWFHAGRSLVAYKLYGEDVIHIAKTPCAVCGDCCRNLPRGMPDVNDKGECVWLGSEGVKNECGKGIAVPFSCTTGIQGKGRTLGCSIEWETKKL